MDTITGGGWKFHEGGKRSTYFELPVGSACELELRAAGGAVVHAVTEDGELLFLEEGKVIRFCGRLDGFRGFDVSSGGAYATRWKVIRHDSEVDPVPAVVSVSMAVDPVQAAIDEALRKKLWELQERGMLQDSEVEELLREIEEDELEFDDEPDPFGLGHTEFPRQPELEEPSDHEDPPPAEQDDAPPESIKKKPVKKGRVASSEEKSEEEEGAAD